MPEVTKVIVAQRVHSVMHANRIIVMDNGRITGLDPHENLLDRGLDSIRLMSLLETWRKDGISADFADLAEEPTIAAWLVLLTQQP